MTSYRSQAVASVTLGTPLSFALCGLYATFGPSAPELNYLTAILLLLPTWIAITLWGLAHRDARATWLVLGSACLATAAVIVASMRTLGT